MELEKVTTSKDVESKKPLTQEQAVQRLLTLESELRKVQYSNPNIMYWWYGGLDVAKTLQSGAIYDSSAVVFPLMPAPKVGIVEDYNKCVKLVKRNSRYAFPVSLGAVTISTVTVALTPLSLWFSIPTLVWLISGAIVGISSSLKLYDGSKKNKIRHFLASIFLTKKSKKIIEEHKEKVEKFEFLQPSYKDLVNLVRLEMERDNLLEIANESPDENGNYIIFLERGMLVKVKKEKYLEIKNANKPILTKEETLELTQKMIEQKYESLKLEALSK